MKDDIILWLIQGETGISSEAMAAAVAGVAPNKTHAVFGNHPADPADFNRCLKFLIAVPGSKSYMHKVAELSPVWRKLVLNWDELERVFLEEVGIDWFKGGALKASKTYALMKRLGC